MGESNTKTTIPENVRYPCKDGTVLYTKDGNRAEGDKQIFIKFPENPWMPSIECLLAWIRMKAWLVEENNYPHGEGKIYLFKAIVDAFFLMNRKIRAICRERKIPGF